MTRKHSHRGMMLGFERRKVRLQVRADLMARRSARQLGVVLSAAQLVELREAITSGSLPKTVRYVGRTGTSLDAYAVDLAGVSLIALHDSRGQLITAFAREGDSDIRLNNEGPAIVLHCKRNDDDTDMHDKFSFSDLEAPTSRTLC